MKLYSSRLSSNAKRVRNCIEEVDAHESDFVKGETRNREYLAKHPRGKPRSRVGSVEPMHEVVVGARTITAPR
jgi:hypothetical protein